MNKQVELLNSARLSWCSVSEILGEAISEILGKQIHVRAFPEDIDYFGVIASDYRFSIDDLTRLLGATNAPHDVQTGTIPEDDSATKSIGMDLAQLLLMHNLHANWSELCVKDSFLWLLDYTVQLNN